MYGRSSGGSSPLWGGQWGGVVREGSLRGPMQVCSMDGKEGIRFGPPRQIQAGAFSVTQPLSRFGF